jgi:hypothetical protein
MLPTQPPATSPPLDPRGFIAAHTPCGTCQYELLGLKPDGVCPECGSPVASSFTGPLLRCVPMPSLLRLRFGLRLVLAGYACLAVMALMVFAIYTSQFTGDSAIHLGQLLISLLLAAGALVVASNPAANPTSDSSLAKGIFLIISLCLILSAATMLLAPLRSTEFSQEASFGVRALFALSFGAMGTALCLYLGRMTGIHGCKRLRTVGRCLAMPWGLVGLLGSFADLMLANNPTGGPTRLEMELTTWGILLGAISIVGILIYLPRVLRFVAAEIKIVQGWANPREPLTCPAATDANGRTDSEPT